MRRLAMLLWLAWMAIPAFGAKPVKVHELEDAVQSARGFSDGKLARKISGMELTERLSEARFELLYAGLPGARSRHALMQLADMAAFLDPPAEDVAARPMPPMTEQVNILLRTVDYEKEMLPKLPNFFATRDVQRFLELKPVGMHGEDVTTIYDRLHPFDKAQDIVLYRDGKEVVDSGGKKRKYYDKAEGLTTHGVFGPILGVVLTDATHGNLKWGHWEEGTDGPVAVFDFHVAKEKSHYQVTFCCFTSMSGMQEEFKQYTPPRTRDYEFEVEKLKEVDVAGVAPTAHAIPVFNVFRQDVPRDWFDAKTALANAPRQAAGLFSVTKVVE